VNLPRGEHLPALSQVVQLVVQPSWIAGRLEEFPGEAPDGLRCGEPEHPFGGWFQSRTRRRASTARMASPTVSSRCPRQALRPRVSERSDGGDEVETDRHRRAARHGCGAEQRMPRRLPADLDLERTRSVWPAQFPAALDVDTPMPGWLRPALPRHLPCRLDHSFAEAITPGTPAITAEHLTELRALVRTLE
jgi:hypothetical protein